MTANVGRPLQRREDFRFLTGRGRYVDDINLPGTLHLAILRSPHAHAIITGLDLSAAKAAAGVRLALAGAGFANAAVWIGGGAFVASMAALYAWLNRMSGPASDRSTAREWR